MKQEIHLFIIWEKARKKTDELFKDIEEKFEIRDMYEVIWKPKNFPKNLKKFYGVTLPDPLRKISQIGTGPFLIVVVVDKNPKHGIRRTSLGKQLVNTNIYDSKRKFRKLFGGGFPIHGSIHEKEANHDLTLLLGKNLEQISNEINPSWDGKIKKIDSELVGIDYWNNLEQLFFVLNNTINYVVLRNYEKLPKKNIDERYEDIDILTDDDLHIPYILGKNLKDDEKPNFPFVNINGKLIKFDIKYVGDTYLDEKWAKKILKRKILTSNSIYAPSKEDHFYTLLHHIVVQQTNLKSDYKETLNNLGNQLGLENIEERFSDRGKLKEMLDGYLEKNGYRYTNSFEYKITHNELLRLVRVTIRLAKSDGIKEVIRATRGKLQRIR